MFSKIKNKSLQDIAHNSDFAEIETEIMDQSNKDDDKVIEMLHELEDIVFDKAFLEGYKTGIKESLKEQIKEKPENFLGIEEVIRLKEII